MMLENKWDRLLLIAICMIGTLIFARDILGFGVNRFMLLGLVSALLIVLPFKQCAYLSAFILPITCGMLGYVTIVAFVCIIFKGKYVSPNWSIPLIILISLEFFSLMLNGVYHTELRDLLCYFSALGLFFYMIFFDASRVNLSKFILYFLLGSSVVLLIITYQQLTLFTIEQLISGMHRTERAMAEVAMYDTLGENVKLNANSTALYSITSFSILLVCKNYLNINRVLSVILFAISFISGLLTVSRTWMLVLILTVFLYIIWQQKVKSNLKAFFAVLSVLVIVIAIAPQLVNSIFEMFGQRFEDDGMSTAGGRSTIFVDYNKLWFSNITYVLFGTGAVYYGDVINYPLSMHNSIQQIYVCTGIIGVFTFLSTIIVYINKYVKNKHIPKMFYIPIISCFVFSQSVQFLYPYILMYPFIFAICAIRLYTTSQVPIKTRM